MSEMHLQAVPAAPGTYVRFADAPDSDAVPVLAWRLAYKGPLEAGRFARRAEPVTLAGLEQSASIADPLVIRYPCGFEEAWPTA